MLPTLGSFSEARGGFIVSTKSAAAALGTVLAIAASPLASSASTAAGTWAATANLAIPRANLTATPLEDGRILVVGGVDELSTELYDPPTGTWLAGGALNETHWGHLAVRLRDGRVLVSAGAALSVSFWRKSTTSWFTCADCS